MVRIVSKKGTAERGISGEKCQSPDMPKEPESISCIWCYLVKEGVKKAHAGIRRIRATGVKQE